MVFCPHGRRWDQLPPLIQELLPIYSYKVQEYELMMRGCAQQTCEVWYSLFSCVNLNKDSNEKQVYSFSAINITLCALYKPQGCHSQLFCRVFRNECVPLRELKRDLNEYETEYIPGKKYSIWKKKNYTQLIYEHNFNWYILFLIAKNS